MCDAGGTGSSIGSWITSCAGNPTDDEVAPEAPLGSGVAVAAGGALDDGAAAPAAGEAVDEGWAAGGREGGGAWGDEGGAVAGDVGVVWAEACAARNNDAKEAKRRGAWRMGPIVRSWIGAEARR